MATLILSAVGTLVGGPVGGSIGALVGRQIDGEIFGGGGRREGPRLKDLAVTTSSYGQPLPRHFGRMRVSGSVIWATDLVENRETGGGGKGQPKTTTYSYTSSFAVALASRPIDGVGRIWADGALLRGASGDLKTGGSFRVHAGHGDQRPDPLIASAEGAACPAFRNTAYAVFEDLDLADFGNRIPALTFEVFAGGGPVALEALLAPSGSAGLTTALPGMEGYSHESGSLGRQLEAIDAFYPLVCDVGGDALSIALARQVPEGALPMLPTAALADDQDTDDGAGDTGPVRARAPGTAGSDAIRYYDVERDFQPGLQRSDGRPVTAASRTVDFPAALRPDRARALITAASQRDEWVRDTLAWRVAELDPALRPGDLVRVPDIGGIWRIAAWEWHAGAIDLELVRVPPVAASAAPGESGTPGLPVDAPLWPTHLRAFELPWDGTGDPSTSATFAAATAGGPSWRGAALYAQRQGALVPLGATGQGRSVSGALVTALPSSPALRFEPQAALTVELAAEDLGFVSTDLEGLADGANRLLVGAEILQFASAERIGDRTWKLAGLLRGRGGTEPAAQAGQPAGAAVTLLDENLAKLALETQPGAGGQTVVAIGRGDSAPVSAAVELTGATTRPLMPVHPLAHRTLDGALELRWIRRARGAWGWPAEVEVPVVEQAERYRVGIGPSGSPHASWEVGEPGLTIGADDHAALALAHPAAPVWVRQLGSVAASAPLLLCHLD